MGINSCSQSSYQMKVIITAKNASFNKIQPFDEKDQI